MQNASEQSQQSNSQQIGEQQSLEQPTEQPTEQQSQAQQNESADQTERNEEYQALFVRIVNMHNQMRDVMHHSIQGESHVLMKLAQVSQNNKNSAITPSFLAQATRVTSGRISVVLSSLEKKGFVVRTSDEHDRRVVHVAITEAGKDEVKRLWKRAGDAIYVSLEHMGLEKSEQFVSLLEEFFANFHIE